MVICESDSASMPLVLSSCNHYVFADKFISRELILTGYGLALVTLHELISPYGHIVAVLHKNAISVNKVLVPEEEVVLEGMLYRCNESFVLPLLALNHRIMHKRIALHVTTSQSSSSLGGGQFLLNINNLDTINLALLIDDLEIVFMNLKY